MANNEIYVKHSNCVSLLQTIWFMRKSHGTIELLNEIHVWARLQWSRAETHAATHWHTHTQTCIPKLEHPAERYLARARANMARNKHRRKATLARRKKDEKSHARAGTAHGWRPFCVSHFETIGGEIRHVRWFALAKCVQITRCEITPDGWFSLTQEVI